MAEKDDDKVRLDKWLWAARFFKTRALAKAAIEGGKVHCEGARVKASREITTGMTLRVRQGWDEKTVEVLRLSDQRRGAIEAQQLYNETAESIASREATTALRQASGAQQHPDGRPTKRNRRMIHRFKQDNTD